MSELTDYLRQFGAGLATIPSEMMRAGAIVANPMRFARQLQGTDTELDRSRTGGVAQVLQGAGDAWNGVVNRTLGVEDPSLLDDTGQALSRIAGGSVITAPANLAARAAAAAPAGLRLAATLPVRMAELITPVTFTNRTTQVGKTIPRAANVGVQAAAGTAIEYAMEDTDPTVPVADFDADGNITGMYTPASGNTPGAGRIAARGVVDAVGEHPVATGVGGAALVGLGLLAGRSARRAMDQRTAAAQSDVMKPLDRSGDDVPIIDSAPRNAANRFAEVVQDANIRTKDAIQQVDPDPARARAATDAIDMVQEPSHKARLGQMLDDGVIVTPRGTRQTESLHRIAEDLYHKSIDKPELSTKAKELVILETEADNRAHQVRKDPKNQVLIDTATGLKPEIGTPPARMLYVTPRATLHHLSDAQLDQRIQQIRNSEPEAVNTANRYWKLHSDLADAWVDFGLVSKKERAMWGRANPHFMHTINLDDPKSPRTYRAREHGSGPREGGDPFLAATEYADFMLAQVYRNRMRKQVVESLRAGAAVDPGLYGNGKWIGRVAHPAEIRRRQVIDPKSGKLRNMTKEDLDIKGDSISYYDEGELVEVEIRNKQLLHTLQTSPAVASTILGNMRQLAQSGMTGKLATLTGQPFTVANAVMGAIMALITRPAGRALGYADQAAQAVTGKLFGTKIGIRGDPTAIPGMLNAGVRDVSAILTRTVSDALHNSLAADGLLSKVPGARRIADTAARKYVDSMYAANHRIGSGTASTLGDRDFDTAANRSSVISTVTPHGNSARVIGKPADWKEELQQLAGRVTPADAKIAARMFSDINEAIGNMAQSFLFRQNYGSVKKLDDASRVPEAAYAQEMAKALPHRNQITALVAQARAAKKAGNSQQARQLFQQAQAERQIVRQYELAAQPYERAAAQAREAWFREYSSLGVATRQLLGDPAMRGTGLRDLGKSDATWGEKATGRIIDATPYANIGMQATARLIQAAKENPGGTAAALGMVVAPMALYPIWNAVRLDRERAERGEPPLYVPYELSRPSWDSSRQVLGAMGGLDPDRSPRLRIDPGLSLVYTVIREGIIELFGLNRSPSDPYRAFSEQQLERIVQGRIYENISTAALNAQPISQFPPIIGAGFAAVGVELPPFEKLVSRGSAAPLSQRGMGGYEGSRLNNDVISKTLEAVLGQLFGGAGMAWVGMVRSGWQAEQRVPGTFGSAAFDEVKGRAQDRLAEFQPLWGQPVKRATSDTIADLVNSKEQAMKRVTANRASLTGEGTVGSGNLRSLSPEGGGRAGVADPQVRQLLGIITRFESTQNTLRQARTRVREVMLDIEQRALPYADRRLALNEQSREINRINSELLARYVRFEDQMSERLGVRIRLEQIDPTKPFSQFKPLEQ